MILLNLLISCWQAQYHVSHFPTIRGKTTQKPLRRKYVKNYHVFSMACGVIQAAPKPKVQQVEIVGPSMIPVDVVNTVGVEIVGPSMIPVDVMNEVEVKIVGPSMIPVDVMNTVKIVGPMFFPKEIIETMISADEKADIDIQVIREIVVLPTPNESAAAACRVHVSLDGIAISHGSWNGNEYGSFSLSLPRPIDVEAQSEILAELSTLGESGKCSADLVVIGTLVESEQ